MKKHSFPALFKIIGVIPAILLCVFLLSSCAFLNAFEQDEQKTILPAYAPEELEAEAAGLYGEDWAAQLNAAAVGDSIFFGFYEQDGDLDNGREPIEWILIKREGTKHTLISRYSLDYIDYFELVYEENWTSNYSWETCTMRRWLHETFLANSFTAGAMSYIVPVPFSYTLAEDEPPIETVDSVYLLAPEEVLKYFPDWEEPLRNGTEYFISQYGDTTEWALRGSVDSGNVTIMDEGLFCNAFSTSTGSVYDGYGFTGAVRPVLTVNTAPESIAAQKAQLERYGEELYRDLRCNSYTLRPEEYEAEYALMEKYGSEWHELWLHATEGETVTFGCYEQDNDLSNDAEPISWLVVKRTDGELWLLSEKILDAVPFDAEPRDGAVLYDRGAPYLLVNDELVPLEDFYSWTVSSLCLWLNGDFASAAFTDSQMKLLKDSNSMFTESYGERPLYSLPVEGDAPAVPIRILTYEEGIDCVFHGECIKDDALYESSNGEKGLEFVDEYTVPGEGFSYTVYLRAAKGTPYAIANGLEATEYGDVDWWLFTDAIDFSRDSTGETDVICTMGTPYKQNIQNIEGVRPLICINLSPEPAGVPDAPAGE